MSKYILVSTTNIFYYHYYMNSDYEGQIRQKKLLLHLENTEQTYIFIVLNWLRLHILT